MSLTYRRILYIVFFLIFFITAPMIILMAEGYRYNFNKRALEKTGVLFLESKPTKAQIYLNGKKNNEETTARIKNLLPDDYMVELKKDDYETWQKKMTVYPNQTSFAQYIRLFKTKPEESELWPHKILLTSEAAGENIALIYNQNNKYQLAIFNFDSEIVKPLLELNFLPEKILLSPTGHYIAFNYHAKVYVFDADNKKIKNLADITAGTITKWRWFNNENENNLFAVVNNQWQKIDLVLSKLSPVLKNIALIDGYISNGENFFLIQEKDGVTVKKINSISLNNTPLLLKILPNGGEYEIKELINGQLIIQDNKNKNIYVINTNNLEEKIKIFPEIDYAVIKEQEILLANKFELAIYNLTTKEEKIIVRLSQEINQAGWYPLPTHIIFATNDGAKIIETVLGEKMQHNLISQRKINNIFINDKGDTLYFADENGFYRAQIQ